MTGTRSGPAGFENPSRRGREAGGPCPDGRARRASPESGTSPKCSPSRRPEKWNVPKVLGVAAGEEGDEAGAEAGVGVGARGEQPEPVFAQGFEGEVGDLLGLRD